MRILVGCEWSAVVRDAFREHGHDAWSCDTEPTAGDSSYHIRGDVRDILDSGWDMGVFFPPCTYLANVGNDAMHQAGRRQLRWEALDFIEDLMDAPIARIAIENPVGCISRYIRKPDQIIQPYWFGDPFKKRTCLWLKNLPPLTPTKSYWESGDYPSWVSSGARDTTGIWSGKRNAKIKGKTFNGIANAMATQWGEQ